MKFLRALLAFLLTLERSRWIPAFFLLALLTQVPFEELLALSSEPPFLLRLEEWPRFGLHLFQTGAVFGVLSFFYIRSRSSFFGLFLSWRKEALLFFFSCFLFWLYWAPLGFDVTDEGGRLAQSWFMFEGYWEENIDMKLGSHLMNGLWMRVFSEPYLLWARVGYALVKALIGFFTFLLLRRAFSEHRGLVFAAAFWGMLAISVYGGQVMNYNNLPVMLMLGGLVLIQRPSGGEGRWSSVPLLLGGALIPLAAFCRFPFLVFLFLALAWEWGKCFNKELVKGGQKKRAVQFSLGMGGGLLLIGGLLYSIGILQEYFGMIDRKLIEGFLHEKAEASTVHGHEKEKLISLYLGDLYDMGKLFLPLSLVFLLVAYLSWKWREWSFYLTPLMVLIVFMACLSMKDLLRWHYGIVVLPLSMLAFYIVAKRRFWPSPFLAYWGFLLFGISFLGSNNGVFNILITGGGILLFGYVFVLIGRWSKGGHRSPFDPRPVFWGAALFIPLFVLEVKPHKIYRDASRKELTQMMGAPSLFGIFSEPSRVAKVNEVLEACRERITPYKDGLLVANRAPMFYFLTEAPYTLTLDWEMRAKTRKEKEELLNGPNGPRFILLMKKDPRHWDWPKVERPCVEEELPFYRFYRSYLKGPPYRKLFDNGSFSLHKKEAQKEG